jgi:hypothetical protein
MTMSFPKLTLSASFMKPFTLFLVIDCIFAPIHPRFNFVRAKKQLGGASPRFNFVRAKKQLGGASPRFNFVRAKK